MTAAKRMVEYPAIKQAGTVTIISAKGVVYIYLDGKRFIELPTGTDWVFTGKVFHFSAEAEIEKEKKDEKM